jgi:hypothetical protein
MAQLPPVSSQWSWTEGCGTMFHMAGNGVHQPQTPGQKGGTVVGGLESRCPCPLVLKIRCSHLERKKHVPLTFHISCIQQSLCPQARLSQASWWTVKWSASSCTSLSTPSPAWSSLIGRAAACGARNAVSTASSRWRAAGATVALVTASGGGKGTELGAPGQTAAGGAWGTWLGAGVLGAAWGVPGQDQVRQLDVGQVCAHPGACLSAPFWSSVWPMLAVGPCLSMDIETISNYQHLSAGSQSTSASSW